MTSDRENDARCEEAIRRVRRVLDGLGWEPEVLDDERTFFVDFGPPHRPVSGAMAAITRTGARFLFYINFGVAVPAEMRREVEHFVTLVNWGLSIPTFELDHTDGHLRVRSSIDFADAELSEQLIRNAILAAMEAVETYGDTALEVVAGSLSAEKAAARRKD